MKPKSDCSYENEKTENRIIVFQKSWQKLTEPYWSYWNYFNHFPYARKTFCPSENLKIKVIGIVIESPHHWITKTEVLSNTCAFVWFNGLIIKLTSPFLRDIVLESLSVFMNDGESLLLFSKGVYREVKNLSNAHSQVWDNFWHLKDHKNDEKYLLFHLKALFFLNIFKFLSWLFGHEGKTAWLER